MHWPTLAAVLSLEKHLSPSVSVSFAWRLVVGCGCMLAALNICSLHCVSTHQLVCRKLGVQHRRVIGDDLVAQKGEEVVAELPIGGAHAISA